MTVWRAEPLRLEDEPPSLGEPGRLAAGLSCLPQIASIPDRVWAPLSAGEPAGSPARE